MKARDAQAWGARERSYRSVASDTRTRTYLRAYWLARWSKASDRPVDEEVISHYQLSWALSDIASSRAGRPASPRNR